mmetsp:Transcript_8688/g.21025  ORF Transcript_8688/g.21025 Transcript_8688/m.21025 type:complete len:479 (-) Transcript_8688:995-2431(-)
MQPRVQYYLQSQVGRTSTAPSSSWNSHPRQKIHFYPPSRPTTLQPPAPSFRAWNPAAAVATASFCTGEMKPQKKNHKSRLLPGPLLTSSPCASNSGSTTRSSTARRRSARKGLRDQTQRRWESGGFSAAVRICRNERNWPSSRPRSRLPRCGTPSRTKSRRFRPVFCPTIQTSRRSAGTPRTSQGRPSRATTLRNRKTPPQWNWPPERLIACSSRKMLKMRQELLEMINVFNPIPYPNPQELLVQVRSASGRSVGRGAPAWLWRRVAPAGFPQRAGGTCSGRRRGTLCASYPHRQRRREIVRQRPQRRMRSNLHEKAAMLARVLSLSWTIGGASSARKTRPRRHSVSTKTYCGKRTRKKKNGSVKGGISSQAHPAPRRLRKTRFLRKTTQKTGPRFARQTHWSQRRRPVQMRIPAHSIWRIRTAGGRLKSSARRRSARRNAGDSSWVATTTKWTEEDAFNQEEVLLEARQQMLVLRLR